jgi:hypothetical protein
MALVTFTSRSIPVPSRKLPLFSLLAFFLPTAYFCLAQQPPAQAPPKVKVNMLNVCNPSADEQQQIASALSRIPKEPLFSQDFEVDRGQSSLAESPDFLQPGSGTQPAAPDVGVASWVRIRREFAVQALFSTVQYSFSMDPKNMLETIVFHVRDPKDLLEVSIEDSASAVTAPAAMLDAKTPANHIKLARFGKPSVALARCSAPEGSPSPDQSVYEPLFQSASAVINQYRGILAARRLVPEELARIAPPGGSSSAKPNSKLRKPAQPQK